MIAGHVDSRSGPAVFYRLDELAAGDRVEVARSDGQVFAYRVATVESHPKTPSRRRRSTARRPAPELRLITCGGVFDRSSRHYRDNVVVTAVPVQLEGHAAPRAPRRRAAIYPGTPAHRRDGEGSS